MSTKNKIAVFDMNETTFSMAPVMAELDDIIGTEGGYQVWFQRLLHIALTITTAGYYKDFSTLAQDSLQAVAATGNRELPAEDFERLAKAMGSIRPYADVVDALNRLKEKNWTLVALTNSSRASVEKQLNDSGLRTMFDYVVSVDEVKAFKPAAAPYLRVAKLTGAELRDMWMVACHDWDIAGAAAVGMSTAYVSRPGKSYAHSYPEADIIVEDFGQLADVLI